MSLTLTQHTAPPGRIALAGITPDRLAGMGVAEIERIELHWGKNGFALADFFRVSGTPGATLAVAGADPRFSALGGGMRSGRLVVEGEAGDFIGQDMAGGTIEVRGNAGHFAASGMAGGELRIAGNAGDSLGAALPWLGAGMKGGRVVVAGSVGARCADRLRRGEIFIGGNVGEFCGTRMVAGTIVLAGTLGARAGFAMRRGTLLLLGAAFDPPPTFVETVMCAEAYLGLVWRDWAARFEATDRFGAYARQALAAPRPARRFMGDLATGGRGEVFAFAP